MTERDADKLSTFWRSVVRSETFCFSYRKITVSVFRMAHRTNLGLWECFMFELNFWLNCCLLRRFFHNKWICWRETASKRALYSDALLCVLRRFAFCTGNNCMSFQKMIYNKKVHWRPPMHNCFFRRWSFWRCTLMRLAGGVLQYTRTRALLLDYQPNCWI